MPPKKKDAKDDLGFMRAARFGRVKNTLSMGFGKCVRLHGKLSHIYVLLSHIWYIEVILI